MNRFAALCAVITVIAIFFGLAACGGEHSGATETGANRADPAAAVSTEVVVGEPTNLTAAEGAEKEEKRDMTLLVYMIGADLESKTAAATGDIEEMSGCGLDPQEINLLIYTGGCQYWHNGIPADTNYLYRCDSATGELTQLAYTDGIYSMANAQTLTDVLNHVGEYYPAEHYGLVFWDHGTGSVIGYGSDQLFEKDSLNLRELAAALDASVFGDTLHFDFIGFDACLMGSLETAVTVAPFADYLIASEETEPGAGWDYTVLADVSKWDDPLQLSKQIIDGYAAAGNKNTKKKRSVPDRTLSCMDLSKTGPVVTALDALCDEISKEADGNYAAVSRLRAQTKEFAAGYGLDQIDLGHFTSLAESKWASPAKSLNKAIGDLVVYQTANVENACGVSFYFPYSGEDLYAERGTGSLAALYDGRSYSGFITDFLSAISEGKEESHGLGDCEENEDAYVLQLSDEDRQTLASAYYSVYQKGEDDGYNLILAEMALEPDENGELRIPLKQKGVFWKNAEGGSLLCPARMVEHGADRTCFSVKFAACTDTVYAPYMERQNCEARLMLAPGETKAVIQNILLESDSAFVDRNELDLEHYSYIWVNYANGKKPKKNDDGEMLPYRDWELLDMTWFNYCPIGTDYGFVLDELDTTEDDYAIQLTVKDVYGNEFSSELITPANAARYSVKKQNVSGGKVKYTIFDDHAMLSAIEGEVKDLNVPERVEGQPVTQVRAYYYNENAVLSYHNPYLETVTLPDTVREICDEAFAGCTNLRQVKLGNGLVSIGANAFQSAPINEISLPDTLEFIGTSAFHGCTEYVSSWGDDSFSGDSYYAGVSEVTLPAGIKQIGEGAFSGCRNLKSITVKGSSAYQTKDGVLFTADGKTLLCYPAGKTEESYTLPAGVERIGSGAFGSTLLKTVDAGNSLREIGPYAFYYNDNLEQCALPDTLESIGAYAFYNEYIFSDTHPDLTSVRIGPAVSRIGEAAFTGARVKAFDVSEENRSYSAQGNMLMDKSSTVLLCMDTADDAVFTVPDGVVTLARKSLSGCSHISGLVLPDSVVSMEWQQISGLPRLEIGAGLKNVDSSNSFSSAEIVISPKNPYLKAEDGRLVPKDAE